MIPIPTPDQAVHVLEILGEWTKRGWWYRPRLVETGVRIEYHNPGPPSSTNDILVSFGMNHFEALCQATTVMQMLLEEHPEKL